MKKQLSIHKKSTSQEPMVRHRGRPREFDREQVLAKAMRLFWERGYESTSTADLRAHSGLTQASLYAAFDNKESLFREAVALYRQTAGITTQRALATGQTAKDSMRALLQDAVDTFTAKDAPGGCLLVLGAVNCSPENEATQAHLRALRRETEHSILKRLERGQKDGDVPKEAPIQALASFYTTVLHGLSIQSRDGVSRSAMIGAVECAMASWQQLVETKKSVKKSHSSQ